MSTKGSKTANASGIDPKLGLKQVEYEKSKFEFKITDFGTQIAFSSAANIAGQVGGHPLDTIRVSLRLSMRKDTIFSLFNRVQSNFVCDRSECK